MSIASVIHCMERQVELHTLLLELAEQKKQVLIDNDVEKLNQIVHKESQLARQVGELEQERLEAVNQFLVSKCYKPNPKITVSDLVQLLFKVEEKRTLKDAQERLLDVVGRLKKANELNQQLLQSALQFTNYSLDVISGGPDEEATYSHPAQQQTGLKRPGMFDTRA